MSSFEELGVSAPVVRALAAQGIHEPFEIQALVMRDALAGRDVLAKSRTGSGKTLAFAIPLVERLRRSSRPSALVLVPTRELAVQVTEETAAIAATRGLRVASVYGGVGLESQARRAARSDIIVATPGRMQDLLDRKLVSLAGVSALVLDEADRMLDMGFLPQVDRIVRHVGRERQTMLFSATLDGRVSSLAGAYTNEPIRHEVVTERPVIAEATHRFMPVEDHARLELLIDLLDREKRELALVFVRTKRGADRLSKKLNGRRVAADALHGDMTQGARKKALDRFSAGRVDVLVATDVAARGLDLDGITHVINFDPPNDHKDYVHRVGRTARAGRSGTGVTFVAPAQIQDVGIIAVALKLHEEFGAEGLTMPKPQRVFSSHGRRSRGRMGGGRRS